MGGSARSCPSVAFLVLGAPSNRLVLLRSPKMSDVLAPVTLLPSEFLDCGSVAMFVPAVRGVDVTTCGWPVVIGFMCANAVLRGAGMCCVCGLVDVGLQCCN